MKPGEQDTLEVLDEIKHYGVKGMQWGVRKDGKPGSTRGPASRDHKVAAKLRRKGLHELSNEDLRKVNQRLQLEKTYKSLSKRELNFGEKIVMEVVKDVGKSTLGKVARWGIDKVTSLFIKTDG